MDNNVSFLHDGQVQLLFDILARRNADLHARIKGSGVVSRADADQIVTTLSDELTDHLDDDWEPNDYGQIVSKLLAAFNATRIAEWPENRYPRSQ